MLGFFQVTVAIIVETLVIYYLSTLTELMKIIVKFVSLAKIVQFDNMYARSLYEHTIQGVSKKKLKVQFYRRYLFLNVEAKLQELEDKRMEEEKKIEESKDKDNITDKDQDKMTDDGN